MSQSIADELRQRLANGDDCEVLAQDAIDKVERFQQLWLEAEERWRGGVTPWSKEIRRLRDLLAADDSDAARMTEGLIIYYNENVMPVSQYCSAFQDWARALRELLDDPDCTDYQRKQYEPVVVAIEQLWPLPISKSNYLYRRLYAGETHRTEKCHIHKGHWSGCYPPGTEDGDCACVSGGNTTGWLPVALEEVDES